MSTMYISQVHNIQEIRKTYLPKDNVIRPSRNIFRETVFADLNYTTQQHTTLTTNVFTFS